jgi:hypothetical protein
LTTAPDAAKCNIRARDLTAAQWAYVAALQELLDTGRVPTVTACCAAAKIHRTTVWRWFQRAEFLQALDRVLAARLDPRDRLVDYAVQRQAMEGRTLAIEANLRRRGLWDGPAVDLPPGTTGTAAGASAVASVTFVGLPAPPTPAQANAVNPPPGANYVYRPPQLPGGTAGGPPRES